MRRLKIIIPLLAPDKLGTIYLVALLPGFIFFLPCSKLSLVAPASLWAARNGQLGKDIR